VKDYEMSEVNAKKLEKENSLLTSYNSKKADIEKEKQDYIKSWEYDVGPKITLALGKLGDIRSEILNNKSEIKITSDNINALTEKIDSSKTSLSLEQPRCYECNSEVGIKERKILVEKLAQRESKKSELVDKLSELNKMLDKNLIIEAEKKKEHSNCVLSLETAKKIADEKAAEKLKSLKSAYDTSIDKLESIVREKKRNVTDKHASDIIRLDGELDNIRLDLVALNKEAKIIEEKTQTLNREKEYLMKYTVRMESLKNSEFDDMQMKDAKEKILELTEKQSLLNDRLKTLKNDMEKMLFWKAGFSSTGIPAMLIDEVIPYMNDRIMFYLSKIGPRFVVSFDTISTTKDGSIRDKIGINVLDTVTLSNSRKKLSPGQARIIDIATIFTLKDLQSKIQEMNTNIIILDEIFDSLDDINIGFVSDLLRTLVEGKCINIISHRYIDQIEADNIYRL
jgi:DNA repair exonuclease SbcCD ATPase subunit